MRLRWICVFADNGVGSTGHTGPQGQRGPPGSVGPQGVTGFCRIISQMFKSCALYYYIVMFKHRRINDAGLIMLRGTMLNFMQPDAGNTGATGIRGFSGATGASGERGSTGESGRPGVTGGTGATGPGGRSGATGDSTE